MALVTGVQHLCTFNIVVLLIYHLLSNDRKASYTISASIFADVPFWPSYSTGKFISCVVPAHSQWFLHFGEEIVIAWTREKTTTLGGTEPHHSSWNARSHTTAVTDLLRRWQWEILEHPPYSPDMSPVGWVLLDVETLFCSILLLQYYDFSTVNSTP